MSILSGYKKVKNYIETGSGKKLLSRWTSSNTVEFNDGKTAQTKVGAIKGITTSTSATETGYAADATTVAALNQSLGNLKTDFNKLNSIKINAGSIVKEAKSGQNSFVLFTLEEIKKIFNSQNVTANHIAISICNGDGNAFPFHLESVTVVNNNWYVVCKDILKINMNCRVQYVIFYWGK